MLTCKHVSERVPHSMDRRLGRLERWRLAVHLKACEGCRNFQKQITFLRLAFRNHRVIRDREDK
jgi:predicted anti-sigma-YlaC factor YlaD